MFKHIRFHYIQLDGPTPFAAFVKGDTLHLMINAKAVVDQDEWVREYLLDHVADLALNPPPAAQKIADIIDISTYLQPTAARPRLTSNMVTADRQ